MAASVTVGTEEITILLSGWNALPALRRIVRIPMAAIRTVKTERFGVEDTEDARTGVAAPLTGVRSGSFVSGGRRYLLAYRPGVPTVTLELDREHFPDVDYDVVVLGVDPGAVEASVEPAPGSAA